MKSRLFLLITLLITAICVVPSTRAQTDDELPGNGRQLRDLHVFSDYKFGQ